MTSQILVIKALVQSKIKVFLGKHSLPFCLVQKPEWAVWQIALRQRKKKKLVKENIVENNKIWTKLIGPTVKRLRLVKQIHLEGGRRSHASEVVDNGISSRDSSPFWYHIRSQLNKQVFDDGTNPVHVHCLIYLFNIRVLKYVCIHTRMKPLVSV